MQINLGPLGIQTIGSLLLLTVGVGFTSYVLFILARFVLSSYALPGWPLSKFGPKGSWVVITGASDGVGKEFARQVAGQGYNLILVSRTKSKLEAVAADITSKYPSVKTEVLTVDFTSTTEEDYKNLDAVCNGKHIAVLINNVGQSHHVPVLFNETPMQEMNNIINVNIYGTLRVTKTILPHMLAKNKGLILTMGSFGGMAPTPYLATYSGSKAFLQMWSTALGSELIETGVKVHFIQAYTITSAMSKIRRPNWQTPTEKAFVKVALGKLGNQCGSIGYKYTGSPFWSHAGAAFIIIWVYGVMSAYLMEVNRQMHMKIRKRALAKAEREAQNAKKTT